MWGWTLGKWQIYNAMAGRRQQDVFEFWMQDAGFLTLGWPWWRTLLVSPVPTKGLTFLGVDQSTSHGTLQRIYDNIYQCDFLWFKEFFVSTCFLRIARTEWLATGSNNDKVPQKSNKSDPPNARFGREMIYFFFCFINKNKKTFFCSIFLHF